MNLIIRTIVQKKAVLVIVLSLALGLVVMYFNIDADDVIYNSSGSTGGISKDAESLSKFALSSGTGVQSVTTTNWGASPFDRSSPGMQAPKLIFKRPNVDWPARQVTLKNGMTITYVFGEGDPKEVELKRKEDESDAEFMHQEVVSKKFENNLRKFLINPLFTTLINKCDDLLRSTSQSYPSIDVESGDFDLERIISINEVTKRKEVDSNVMLKISTILAKLDSDHGALAKKCLNGIEVGNFPALRDQFAVVDMTLQNNPDEFYLNSGLSSDLN